MTQRLRVLRAQLPRGVEIVTFSVDPKDTPEILARYARDLKLPWNFLAGQEVEKLCREGFKLPVAKGRDPAEPILHSKNLALVDAEGIVRGYYDATDGAQLAALARYAAALLAQ